MTPKDIASVRLQIVPVQWNMQQVPADINIKQAPADLEIDYTETRASIGYEKPLAFQVSFSRQAQETLQQGIERRVSEGKLLGQQVGKHQTFREIIKQEEQKPVKLPELESIQPVKIRAAVFFTQIYVSLGGVKLSYAPGGVHLLGTNLDLES